MLTVETGEFRLPPCQIVQRQQVHGGANGILREDFPLSAEGKPGIFR